MVLWGCVGLQLLGRTEVKVLSCVCRKLQNLSSSIFCSISVVCPLLLPKHSQGGGKIPQPGHPAALPVPNEALFLMATQPLLLSSQQIKEKKKR